MGVTAPSNLTVSGSRSTSFRPAEQDLEDQSASVFKAARAQNGFPYPLSYLVFSIARVTVLSRRRKSSGALPNPSLLARFLARFVVVGPGGARVRAWREGYESAWRSAPGPCY